MEKLGQTKHGQEHYSNQDPYHYQETGSKSIAIETSLGGVSGKCHSDLYIQDHENSHARLYYSISIGLSIAAPFSLF